MSDGASEKRASRKRKKRHSKNWPKQLRRLCKVYERIERRRDYSQAQFYDNYA